MPCACLVSTFSQTLALHAALDRIEHQTLHVLRVDQSLRPDALREPDREPPGAGADVGDRGSVGDIAPRP